jgi:hypothetical protein
VADIITPLIPIPGGSLAGLVWMPPYGNTLVKWGAFINAALTFFIVTSVVYFFIVRPINALVAYHKAALTKEEKMANIQNQLAEGVVSSTAVNYLSTISQNVQQPITSILLRASVITTSLKMEVFASSDGGATYDPVYTTATPATNVSGMPRRIYFSMFSRASDAESATAPFNIYLPPLLNTMIKITVTASGSCTYSLDEFSEGPGMQ